MRWIYITDRQTTADIFQSIARAADQGVEFIQLREKDLPPREYLTLTVRVLQILKHSPVKLLVNSRPDIALAAGAHGVHLPADSIPPRLWRPILPPGFIISVSCHSLSEIRDTEGADFALFGPVFQTPGKGPATGLAMLAAATAASKIPVFALGGVTPENAQSCVDAGAAGVAAIRAFQAVC